MKNLICPNNHPVEATKIHHVFYKDLRYVTENYCYDWKDIKCSHVYGCSIAKIGDLLAKCVFKTSNCQKVGFFCKQCSFLICMQCCEVIPSPNSCLLGHELVWKREKGTCINEENQYLKEHGFTCTQDCLYYICTHCKNTKVDSKVCFNNHKLNWISKGLSCLKCGINGNSGFICEEDNYFTCDSCLKTGYFKFKENI